MYRHRHRWRHRKRSETSNHYLFAKYMCSGHKGGNCKTSINNTEMAPSLATLTVEPAEKLVPVKLNNFLALVTGASTEHKEECFSKGVWRGSYAHAVHFTRDSVQSLKGKESHAKTHVSGNCYTPYIRIGTADWTIEWIWSQHIPLTWELFLLENECTTNQQFNVTRIFINFLNSGRDTHLLRKT